MRENYAYEYFAATPQPAAEYAETPQMSQQTHAGFYVFGSRAHTQVVWLRTNRFSTYLRRHKPAVG